MPKTLEHRRVLLCEGRSDAAFFTNLIRERALPFFQIEYPAEENVAHGWQGFGEKLRGFRATRGFEQVTSVLIVADNDNDPARAFGSVREQIEASGGYPVPAEPLVTAHANAAPSVAVLMLPWPGEQGNLETVCLDSIYADRPEFRECVNAFARCMGVDRWADQAKESKMRLQAGIASLCRSDPATSLSYAWNRPERLIPLTLPCFQRIADFLARFA